MSSSNRLPVLSLAGAVAAALLVASSAAADPTFPGKLAKDWDLPCIPLCTVCHKDNRGGVGTLRTTTNGFPGFGSFLKGQYNLNTADLSSLEPALAAAKKDGTDVDHDGRTDYDELSQGLDPDDPNNTQPICGAGPEFGCVRVARPGPVDDVASVAGALVLVFGAGALRRRAKK